MRDRYAARGAPAEARPCLRIKATDRCDPRIVRVLTIALLAFLAAMEGCRRSVPLAAPAQHDPGFAQRFQPGDVLRLTIWREPTLSGDFTISTAGVVVLPRLGAREVTAESPEALRRSLIAEYARYLRNPSIEIQVLRRVQILGAVRNPGLYPVDATITVADAIALAGGVTPDGRQNHVELVRAGGDVVGLPLRSRVADTAIRSGDQLYVPERNWFARNTGAIVSAATAAVSLIIAFASR